MAPALESIPSSPPKRGTSADDQRTADRREQNFAAWKGSGLYLRHREFLDDVRANKRRLLSYWDGIPAPKRDALERTAALSRERGACTVLLGPRGTGKTQLAAGLALVLASDAAEEDSEWTCRYWAWPDLAEEVRLSFDGRHEDGEAYRDACRVSVLILDEVHEALATPFEVHRFTRIMDRRYGAKLQTIVIANQTPAALAASVGKSVTDRLTEIGTFLECDWPSFRKPLTY